MSAQPDPHAPLRFESFVVKSLQADAWIDYAGSLASFMGGALVLAFSYDVAFVVP